MNAMLGSLLCFVLFASECFAIKGGPPYPGGGATAVGRYAGVLTPDGTVINNSLNTLGIFTLSIPAIGTATGNIILFTNGVYFVGTIQGLAQPNGQLSALANAQENAMVTVINSDGTTTTILQVVSVLDGEITAKVTSGRSFTSAVLLKGTASFSQHAPTETAGLPNVFFVVNGFKQSSSP